MTNEIPRPPADASLLAISQEMRTQNNRCTQHVLFVVMDKVKKYCTVFNNYDGRERKEDVEPGDLCEECAKLHEDDKELPANCRGCDDDAFDLSLIHI